MSSYRSKTLVAAIAWGLSLSCAAARVDVTAGQTVSPDSPGGLSSPLMLAADNVAVLHFSNGTGDSVHGVPMQSLGGWVHFASLTEQTLAGIQGATLQETVLPVGQAHVKEVRAKVALTTPVKSVGIDLASGRIDSVKLTGGLEITAPSIVGTLEGGWGRFSDLTIDLVRQTVYADMLANAGEPYEFRLERSPLFTFDAVTGPTTLPGDGALGASGWEVSGDAGLRTFTARHAITQLKLTDSGRFFFAEVLGLWAPGWNGLDTMDALNLPGSSLEYWGALTYDVTFTSPVPEPSLLVLAACGLGLAAVAGRARRQRACIRAASLI